MWHILHSCRICHIAQRWQDYLLRRDAAQLRFFYEYAMLLAMVQATTARRIFDYAMSGRKTGRTQRPKRRAPTRPLVIGGFLVLVLGLVAANVMGGRGGSTSAGAIDPTNPQQVALGKQIYAAQCASCHGANLEGQANWQQPLPDGSRPAPPHDDSGHTWHHPDEYLFNVTKYGGQRYSPPDYVNAMPGYEGILSDAEIRAVLAYIKSAWSPEVQAAQERANEQAR
jgi:mono/diheme cytochrome c family protein